MLESQGSMTVSALGGRGRNQGFGAASRLRRIQIACGIFASLLYVGADLLAGTLWEGYSFVDQAISELSGIGAPTRPLIMSTGLAYCVLMIAFGLGIWSLRRNVALRVTGALLVGIGVLGFVWTPFPMNPRGSEATFTDLMHSILAGVNVILFLLAIGFGALASKGRFRLYSIATLLGLIAVGAVSFFMAGGQVSTTGVISPPPAFGLIERIDAYGCVVWTAVLAFVLLQEEREASLKGGRSEAPAIPEPARP